MLRKLGTRAAITAGALALVVVSACSFKADVVLTKEFKPVVATAALPYSATKEVDLAKDAPGAWRRRSNVKSLEIVGVEATATRISPASAGQTVSGTLVLSRPSFGPDVTIGTYTHTIAAAAPDSISITMPASGNALIKDAIEGDGKFSVKATATTSGSVDLDVKVSLHLSIDYEAKL